MDNHKVRDWLGTSKQMEKETLEWNEFVGHFVLSADALYSAELFNW